MSSKVDFRAEEVAGSKVHPAGAAHSEPLLRFLQWLCVCVRASSKE